MATGGVRQGQSLAKCRSSGTLAVWVVRWEQKPECKGGGGWGGMVGEELKHVVS